MIRFLIATPLILIALVLGGFYMAYGQVEPCRVLAVEKARRQSSASGLPMDGGIERWARLETSQMSTGECASGILDSWGARLTGGQ